MTIQELKRIYDKSLISRTKEEHLKAVEQYGYALKYVKEQDKDICLKAVEENGYALKYVKEQDKDICLKAVEENGDALQYVKEQDKDICLKAVEQNGYALQYVNPKIFKDMYNEMTIEEIQKELGYKIKIVE